MPLALRLMQPLAPSAWASTIFDCERIWGQNSCTQTCFGQGDSRSGANNACLFPMLFLAFASLAGVPTAKGCLSFGILHSVYVTHNKFPCSACCHPYISLTPSPTSTYCLLITFQSELRLIVCYLRFLCCTFYRIVVTQYTLLITCWHVLIHKHPFQPESG